jgi:hypothetical protein
VVGSVALHYINKVGAGGLRYEVHPQPLFPTDTTLARSKRVRSHDAKLPPSSPSGHHAPLDRATGLRCYSYTDLTTDAMDRSSSSKSADGRYLYFPYLSPSLSVSTRSIYLFIPNREVCTH